jgi:hypothetical protein
VPAHRIAHQSIANQAKQPIETLAHIGGSHRSRHQSTTIYSYEYARPHLQCPQTGPGSTTQSHLRPLQSRHNSFLPITSG